MWRSGGIRITSGLSDRYVLTISARLFRRQDHAIFDHCDYCRKHLDDNQKGQRKKQGKPRMRDSSWKDMIIGRDGSTNTFHFMDGPYAIRCRKKRGILILSFERENTVALPDCETTLDTFCKAVRNAMESLIRKLYLCGRNDKTAPIRGYLKQLDSFLNLLSIVGFRAVDTDVCLTDAVL